MKHLKDELADIFGQTVVDRVVDVSDEIHTLRVTGRGFWKNPLDLRDFEDRKAWILAYTRWLATGHPRQNKVDRLEMVDRLERGELYGETFGYWLDYVVCHGHVLASLDEAVAPENRGRGVSPSDAVHSELDRLITELEHWR